VQGHNGIGVGTDEVGMEVEVRMYHPIIYRHMLREGQGHSKYISIMLCNQPEKPPPTLFINQVEGICPCAYSRLVPELRVLTGFHFSFQKY